MMRINLPHPLKCRVYVCMYDGFEICGFDLKMENVGDLYVEFIVGVVSMFASGDD